MSKKSKNIEAIDLVEMMPKYVEAKKKNPIAADLKFKGKLVKFSGTITNIDNSDDAPDMIDIDISSDPNYNAEQMGELKDVHCFLASNQVVDIKTLKRRKHVSAYGVFVEHSSKDYPEAATEEERTPEEMVGMLLSCGDPFGFDDLFNDDEIDERIIVNDVVIMPTTGNYEPKQVEQSEVPSIVEAFINFYKMDRENKAAAKLKYDGMVVRATGEVSEIIKRKDDSCMVEIDIQKMPGYDDDAINEASYATCYFDSEELNDVAKLAMNEEATVIGAINYRDIEFMQSIYRVSISHCKVVGCKTE